jgi:alpha-beta hydrolase superfamily lysophospholipase
MVQEAVKVPALVAQDLELVSEVDGLRLQAYRWKPARAAEGVVVVSHGAAEHAGRYARFAHFLGQQSLETWALDHRGHGRSPGPNGLGDTGSGGWDGLIADIAQLVRLARATTPNVPLALFGHSMGAFAAQHFCAEYSSLIDAVVLSGSTAFDFPEDMDALPEFLPNLAFEPARTPYDWLSRDDTEVDKYLADPLCGFETVQPVFTIGDLRRLSAPETLRKVRDNLPVLLIAGDRDPLNMSLMGLQRLAEKLREGGVQQIDSRFYAGGRHEMLNELNRDEVMRDIVAWLRAAFGGTTVHHSYVRFSGSAP